MAKGASGFRALKGKGGGKPGGGQSGKPPARQRRDSEGDRPPFQGGDEGGSERAPRAWNEDGPPRRRPRDDDGGEGGRDERRPPRAPGGFGDRSQSFDGPPRGDRRSGGFQKRDDRASGPPREGGFGGPGPRQGGFGAPGPRQGGFGGGGPRTGGFGGGGPRPAGGPRDERRPSWRDRDEGDRRPPPRRDRDERGGPPDRRGPGFGPRTDDREERSGPPRRSGPAGDLLYGRNAVLEALRAGRAIRRVMVATGAHGEVITEIVDEARAKKVNVMSVSRRQLDDMAFNHQGVVAEAAPYAYASLEDVIEAAKASPSPLVLVLDVLQDPQNLGSLLRTAAAVGAQGVVIPEHRAVGVTPAVVKASAGAIERLKIAQVTNLSRAIDALKEVGIWAVGLDASAESTYDKADLNRPLALVVGGEGKGLRPLVRQHCDLVISLPMPGAIESLNAAVAGSIVLYEALRQRGQQTVDAITATPATD